MRDETDDEREERDEQQRRLMAAGGASPQGAALLLAIAGRVSAIGASDAARALLQTAATNDIEALALLVEQGLPPKQELQYLRVLDVRGKIVGRAIKNIEQSAAPPKQARGVTVLDDSDETRSRRQDAIARAKARRKPA